MDGQDPEPITIPRVPAREEDTLLPFQPLSEEDVRKLIERSPNKQCSSDPIWIWLLKECLDSRLLISTLSKQIPSDWILLWKVENAPVKSLLKKLSLELVLPSFRPVSNLPFISELTEKVPVNQLSDHMNKARPLPSGQSALRPFHSTETILLVVQSDILLNVNDQKVTVLRAAFDTIGHSIYWKPYVQALVLVK